MVRGSSGSAVWASAASAEASAAMGLGVPASVKLWPPGPLIVTWKRRLPKGLGHRRVRACAVENNVRRDASGERALIIEVAHAAQIAFALLAHVAQKEQRCGQFEFGLQQRVGNGQHSHDSRAVVAGAGSCQAVAIDDGVAAGFRQGRRYQGALKARRLGRCSPAASLRPAEMPKTLPAASVSILLEPGLGKTGCQPLRARLFAKGRRGNSHQVRLPVHDLLGVAVQPGESGVNGPLRPRAP